MEDKNFEKYFRQQYGKNIPKDSWNTPSDAVWDNINQQLGHQRSRSGWVLFIILGSLILLGSLGFLMWNNHNKNLLIKELQNQLSDCQELSSYNIPAQNEEAVLSVSHADVPAHSETPETPLVTRSEVNINSGNSPMSHNGNHVSKLIKNPRLPLNDFAENTTVMTSQTDRSVDGLTLGEETERGLISEIQVLPAINSTLFASRTFDADKKALSLHMKKDVQNMDERKFEMGVAYGLISWQNRQNGQLENDLNEILIHERLSVSSAIGAAFQYKLNEKWSLSSGVNYFSREMTTMYHVDLPYDSQNEIVNGNEYENTFEHSLPTGWGNVNTTLILSRVLNSSLTGNDFVPVDMSIRHKLHSAELPLMVQYFPWGRENGLFMNAGLNTEWIWSEGTTQMISKSHHNTIKEKDTHSSFDTKQIHNWLFSATLGAGWHRNLNKHIGLRVLAEYGVGLNPVARVENYSLNLDRAGISAAVFYQFPSR